MMAIWIELGSCQLRRMIPKGTASWFFLLIARLFSASGHRGRPGLPNMDLSEARLS